MKRLRLAHEVDHEKPEHDCEEEDRDEGRGMAPLLRESVGKPGEPTRRHAYREREH